MPQHGTVVAICVAPTAGAPLEKVQQANAFLGSGLQGDRYEKGEGSFNKGRRGKRQVTLINARFFEGTGFDYPDSRRNIATLGVELNDLVGKEFDIGEARMRGVKYCDPCERPSKLSGKEAVFKEVFQDCGGLVAEVLVGGTIKVGDLVVPPKKDY